jgi:hypothetical protein
VKISIPIFWNQSWRPGDFPTNFCFPQRAIHPRPFNVGLISRIFLFASSPATGPPRAARQDFSEMRGFNEMPPICYSSRVRDRTRCVLWRNGFIGKDVRSS